MIPVDRIPTNVTPLLGGHIPPVVQVVGYETGVAGITYDPDNGADGDATPPALLIADDGTITREPLPTGTELAYTLGRRHCAGVREGTTHHACENDTAPYCEAHTDTWRCARCVGNCELPLESCREEHAVYLAAFAPATFKIGVTRLWRLHARLREQGADRAAHVHTVSNGRIARELEAEIAGSEGIPDRVSVATKIEGLHRSVDDDAWASLLADRRVVETFDFEYGLDLAEQPMGETLATGTVRGIQGRILVLEHAGSVYAVDLRDLVGYELDPRSTDRDLQSSLGAFG